MASPPASSPPPETLAAALAALDGQEPAVPADSAGIDAATIAASEQVAGIAFTDSEREMMVRNLEQKLARYRRRQGAEFPNSLEPAHTFDPWLGQRAPQGPYQTTPADPGLAAAAGPLPQKDQDIAYAPAWQLSHWVQQRSLSSERLTRIYLERIRRLDPKVLACITVTEERALREARQADAELAAGNSRGPLHGLPYGAKDLFDSAAIRTTWGAEPYADQMPEHDAVVLQRLRDAGAVLLAKTSLGALAYGDMWLDKRTNNPWNLEQGSSGSSAGSAAGTAAGFFAFALGTETYGSIVSPSSRCGVTGLRPTFGRVPRGGAMALCWSMDKIGVIARSVRDTRLVLDVIAGQDAGDASTQDMPLQDFSQRPFDSIRLGYHPDWFSGRGASDADRNALEALQSLGVQLVEVDLPQGPHDALMTILEVEAATAFEEMTRSNEDDLLQWQAPQAWPNSFRAAWMIPAIEFLQADRYRRTLCRALNDSLHGVDALFSPSFAASLLLMTNYSGHPCLCLRTGFRDNGTPRNSVLWGQLAGEGSLFRLGEALEAALGVASLRPELEQ